MPVTDLPDYRLVVPPARVATEVRLDPSQAAVVELVRRPGHGPVLVLAGPGTGKTTTLVEAVAARVLAGADPERILTLTFSRKAAGELRDRIGARLGQTVMAQSAWTFHAFAYALAGDAQPPEDAGRALHLLSGPEQDVLVRDLLVGDLLEGTGSWPDELLVALRTRGFADEVRTLLARARGLGLEPHELRRLAAGVRPDWSAAADFLAQYLDVLDAQGLVDYSELVHRAVVYAESVAGRSELRRRYDLVVVDEYQDTDPAQERLLMALAGDGRDLVVVGDPDQSIYGFRGAQVRGLLEFRDRFPAAGGARAQVRTLGVSRRAGRSLLAASRSVGARMPVAGAGLGGLLREHRSLVAAPGLVDGSVEVLTFASSGLQLEAVADVLRREHLDDGTPWGDCAVLVRSGARSVPAVRRVLGAAGIPVLAAGDEIPLSREAAVSPLLLALRVAADPSSLTPEVARALLLSPLGGAEASGLRRLGRALREHERAASVTPDEPLGRLPRPSEQLIAEALAEPERLVVLDDRVAGPAQRLGALLARARASAAAGGSAHEILWLLWEGSAWSRRLERAARSGGPAGRAADRDLDVVVALFDLAARDAERQDRPRRAAFLDELEAQQIPADQLAVESVRADGVRLLTAHRTKGLEWRLVVVAGVQEDVWPDLRRRGSLLQADRLGRDGLADPATAAERLAEERRLFYVAVTRASRRLIVTAVDSPEDDGDQPVPVHRGARRGARRRGRPSAPAADPRRPGRRAPGDGGRPATRRAASARGRRPAGGPGVRGARTASPSCPARTRIAGGGPPRAPTPVGRCWRRASPSRCPGRPCLRWLPARCAGSSSTRRTRTLREHGARVRQRSCTRSPTRSDAPSGHRASAELDRLVDSVWGQLAFEAPWKSEQERTIAHAALALPPLARLRTRPHPAQHRARVRPRAGRRRPPGRAARLDGPRRDRRRRCPARRRLQDRQAAADQARVAQHVQLGVYQLAVREGAVEGPVRRRRARPAQAPDQGRPALVQSQPSLGTGSRGTESRSTGSPACVGGGRWQRDLVDDVVLSRRPRDRRRAVPPGARPDVPVLPVPGRLPGAGRRPPGGPVTAQAAGSGVCARALASSAPCSASRSPRAARRHLRPAGAGRGRRRGGFRQDHGDGGTGGLAGRLGRRSARTRCSASPSRTRQPPSSRPVRGRSAGAPGPAPSARRARRRRSAGARGLRGRGGCSPPVPDEPLGWGR